MKSCPCGIRIPTYLPLSPSSPLHRIPNSLLKHGSAAQSLSPIYHGSLPQCRNGHKQTKRSVYLWHHTANINRTNVSRFGRYLIFVSIKSSIHLHLKPRETAPRFAQHAIIHLNAYIQVFFARLLNFSSRGHTLSTPNTCLVDPFESVAPTSLADALLPLNGHGHLLSAFSSSTILINGSHRSKLRSARTCTTQFCLEIVHYLQACHKNESIDLSVVYKSELDNEARHQQFEIPKMEDGKSLDDSVINGWFLINEHTKLRSVHIVRHMC